MTPELAAVVRAARALHSRLEHVGIATRSKEFAALRDALAKLDETT